MKIGVFLQKHMTEKGMNQAELSRRSGVPASTISSIINRNNDRVAIEMMLKLCEILECDIEEYINSLKDEEPQKNNDSLTYRQKRIVELFNYLTESQQDNIIGRAELFSEQNEEHNRKEDVS